MPANSKRSNEVNGRQPPSGQRLTPAATNDVERLLAKLALKVLMRRRKLR